MYYFYVLKSQRDGELYYGFTNDLRGRFTQHQRGQVESTKHRRPIRLVYYEAYASKKDAMRRERQIKLNAKAWGQLKRRIMDSIHET